MNMRTVHSLDLSIRRGSTIKGKTTSVSELNGYKYVLTIFPAAVPVSTPSYRAESHGHDSL